jgi:uncharacterized SAM-binding protein YcdF (DUF218 family)
VALARLAENPYLTVAGAGAMLLTLKTLLHTLLLPPGGPLLLAAAGAWLIGRARAVAARRCGWVLLAAGLGSLWVLATPAVANVLSKVAVRYPPLDLRVPVQAQAIVILGGGDSRRAAPEYGGAPAAAEGLLERVSYAGFLAQRTGLPVLVSGTEIEAHAMSASLARGFHIETRWVEDHSRDTFQNAAFSARILKPAGVSRIILVTDATHEWRAAHEFMSAGFDVIPAPEGAWQWHGAEVNRYIPNMEALAHSTEALYEIIGDIVRRALIALDLRRQSAPV